MGTKRRVFYSFHYKPDNWRASQVRNIGAVEGNKPVSDNDWESVAGAGESAIKKWIDNQMEGRTCTIVLVGKNTANRKYINYEIIQSWNKGMGVVGVHISGLQDRGGNTSGKGDNPFLNITLGDKKKLADVVKCCTPKGSSSQEKYNWISENLQAMVEESINIRQEYDD